MVEDIFWGAIDGGLGEHDLFAGIVDTPKPQYTFLDTRSERRQGTSECALFSAIWALEDNRARKFTDIEINTMRKMLPSYWRTVKDGMYLTKAWDLVVDYLASIWEKRKKVALQTYTRDLYDYLDMWYSLWFGSKIGAVYTKDIKADWDIDELFGGSIWHARRLFKNKKNGNYYIVENYLWSLPYNVIEITPAILEKQITNRKLFNQSFIYYPTDTMITNGIKHYAGNTPKEKETVKAWEDLINTEKIKPLFIDYEEFQGFTKMVAEITLYRDKNKA